LIIIGFGVSLWAVLVSGQFQFAWTTNVIFSIPFLLLGGFMRFQSRTTLVKAGLGVLESTRLRIVEEQKLVTSGVYQYIRHPLYLGEISRNIGVPLFFNSFTGLVLIILGNIFLLIRIRIEEELLIEEFGDEYIEYKKKTKKIIPYVY
jgi:protein-S-isoprenylcysteine O-methyltransferase Ste14